MDFPAVSHSVKIDCSGFSCFPLFVSMTLHFSVCFPFPFFKIQFLLVQLNPTLTGQLTRRRFLETNKPCSPSEQEGMETTNNSTQSPMWVRLQLH